MSHKFYHLGTCSTCKRIIKELDGLLEGVDMVDVKTSHISPEDLDKAAQAIGSYDELVNKRSQTIRAQGIQVKEMDEDQKRTLILSHYSLLKRPLLITDSTAIAGNSKPQVEAMKEALGGK